MEYIKTEKLIIRNMNIDDIQDICAESDDNSEENIKYLKNQIESQEKKQSEALLAIYNGKIAGYLLLYYKLKWGGLGYMELLGIADLIVFKKYQRNGIASELMNVAEQVAAQYSDKIYLEVCLNSNYGAAQRFYIKRGYVPDGKGVYYETKVAPINFTCKNNDELTLCLIKELDK